MEIQFSMKRTPQDHTARSTFIKATQKMGQSGTRGLEEAFYSITQQYGFPLIIPPYCVEKDLSPAHLLVDNILKLQMDLSKL